MAVRFIVGRSGSGKTRFCFEQIVAALRDKPLGPPVFWVLPRQATFQAERQLACDPRLNGFSRARIVSFEELGEQILSACGDVNLPQISAAARRMILGHLLRLHRDRLSFFAGSAHRPGLCAQIDSTFAELERGGQDAATIEQALDELADRAAGASLAAKLRDLRILYHEYNQFLGQDRLDPQRRLARVLRRLEGCLLLKGSRFFVDGFLDFTPYQALLLAGVARHCGDMHVTVLGDPDSPNLLRPGLIPDELAIFHRPMRSYALLRRHLTAAEVAVDEPLLLRETARFSNAALAHVQRAFLDTSAAPQTESDGVYLLSAPDRRTEVDAVALRIRGLLRRGMRLRDIAVLARNLEPYHAIIDASFSEHAIPCFIDRRRTAMHHPLLQFIRSALRIARHDWPHDPLMTLLKSGLTGISLQEADELENYVVQHRIRGRAWADEKPWAYHRRLMRGEDDATSIQPRLDRINALRDGLIQQLKPLVDDLRCQTLTPRPIVASLFAMMERFGVRQQLASWMHQAQAAGRHEQRGEQEQVWAELVKLLEQMLDVLGDQSMALDEFLEILDSGLENFDLALTPPTLDQVLVGQIDRTRPPALKAVFILGCNEGQFPLTQNEDCVLCDSERDFLQNSPIDLEPHSQRRLLDERLLGYIAFTAASEELHVSRPLADDAGRPAAPSPFCSELVRLFKELPIHEVARAAQDDPARIATPRQLIVSLMRWASRPANSADTADDPRPALYQWLAQRPCAEDDRDPIDIMRFRAWKALSYRNAAELSPDIAAKLFAIPLTASAASIESFAVCPFQHFLRFGLRLEDRIDPEVTPQDLGRLYHQILDALVRQLLAERIDLGQLDDAVIEQWIERFALAAGKALRGEVMLSSARNKYLLARVRAMLGQALAAQRAMAQRGQFRPAHTALTYGDEAHLPPISITTPAGRQVLLEGKIDRLDIASDSDFAVIDYRMSPRLLHLDRAYYGISLRLLLDMLAVQDGGGTMTGKPLNPAAGFFMQLLRSPYKVTHPSDALSPDDPAFHLKVKPRGIIDARAVPSLDKTLSDGASDVIQAYIKKDGTFGNRDRSDVTDAGQLPQLLEHIRRTIGILADKIIAGDVSIRPYRIGEDSPCVHCSFRSVCRFQTDTNSYNHLQPLKRQEVLERISQGGGDGQR